MKKFEHEIHDARALEAEEGLSKRDFFAKYGFTLLDHKTQMTHEMFATGNTKELPGTEEAFWKYRDQYANKGTDVKTVYGPELQDLVR